MPKEGSMPQSAAIKSRSHELDKMIVDIVTDTELSGAEKALKLDAMEEDVEAHRLEVKNSARASEWRNALMSGAGDAVMPEGVTDAQQAAHEELKALHADGKTHNAAYELMQSESYAEVVKMLGGPDGMGNKSRTTRGFEIGRKATDATSNLMGEGLYGSTTPTALGQNPFLTGAAGAGILPTWIPGIVEQKFYRLTVPDLFTSIGVDGPAISYLVEAVADFNAADTAEAAVYPYSSETLSRKYEQVGKVTNAIKITDETIRDAPQFFQFAQGRLVMGVQRKEELSILAGAGGTYVNGLLNRSTLFTKPQTISAVTNISFPTSGTAGAGATPTVISSLTYGRQLAGSGSSYPTGQAIAIAIYNAITDIETSAFVDVDAIILNPFDWQIIRLATDDAGQFFGGSFFGANYGYPMDKSTVPLGGGGETLWNRRVVTTPVMPQGSLLVGSCGPEVANIFRRQGLTVEMTNSDGTDFDSGLVTVRCESRLALAVYRPAGFELINLVNG